MKSDYTIRAYKFIEKLYPYIKDCHDVLEYLNAADLFSADYHRKVECASGMVRVAFITSDYVVKFDYNTDRSAIYGGCADEEKFYHFAQEKGFASLLAEITHIRYCGRDFYIMPRIGGIGKCCECYAEEFLHGDELDFVNEYLEDLHDENYGWKNRHPVIIDYAMNRFFLNERDKREGW